MVHLRSILLLIVEWADTYTYIRATERISTSMLSVPANLKDQNAVGKM